MNREREIRRIAGRGASPAERCRLGLALAAAEDPPAMPPASRQAALRTLASLPRRAPLRPAAAAALLTAAGAAGWLGGQLAPRLDPLLAGWPAWYWSAVDSAARVTARPDAVVALAWAGVGIAAVLACHAATPGSLPPAPQD